MPVTWMGELLTNLIGIRPFSEVTGIPRSTLYDYRARKYRPSKYRLNILRRQYERVQYTRLKVAGANTLQAGKYKGGSPILVNDTINKLDRITNAVAKYYGKEGQEGIIKYMMSKSKKNLIDVPPWYVEDILAEEEEELE